MIRTSAAVVSLGDVLTVLDQVPGQDGAMTFLRGAAERPHHAYVFAGPEGSGKSLAARAFAGLRRDASNNDDGHAVGFSHHEFRGRCQFVGQCDDRCIKSFGINLVVFDHVGFLGSDAAALVSVF